MLIPRRKLEIFVRDIANQCFSSRQNRANRGTFFQNYFQSGSADQSNAAMFNKTFTSMDDLESLLYSPVSLRFHIGDPDNPNLLNEAKGRAASSKLRAYARRSDTDTMISAAVRVGLVKGKGFIKQLWKGSDFAPQLIQPESLGVMNESWTCLDENMEAFAHTMMITPHQFLRLIQNHRDRDDLFKKAKRYTRESAGGLPDTQNAAMQVVVGGLYPFQPAGIAPNGMRGVVDWMSQPRAELAAEIQQSMLELVEVWVWDDERQDWATFQIVGNDILVLGKYALVNAFAWDPSTGKSVDCLKGQHPFSEFCTNPVDDYFWGRSEISHLIGLQEAINARIIGTNKMLRKQEDPATKFIGSTGVNQVALSRFRKPGGYWTETNPNAKVEHDQTTIPQDIWASLHEYERMFDDVMGLPPIARGKGEAGVRSAQHANTLVRQFSPRFKDRALLTERNVEGLGGKMLDLARAHDSRKLTAWVAKDAAGIQGDALDIFTTPPAPGLVPVRFLFGDLPEELTLTVDSHSSSPAFAAESRGLHFDLLKVGAEGPEELVEHVDVTDPEELQMSITRRNIARAQAEKEKEAIKLLGHGGRRH